MQLWGCGVGSPYAVQQSALEILLAAKIVRLMQTAKPLSGCGSNAVHSGCECAQHACFGIYFGAEGVCGLLLAPQTGVRAAAALWHSPQGQATLQSGLELPHSIIPAVVPQSGWPMSCQCLCTASNPQDCQSMTV